VDRLGRATMVGRLGRMGSALRSRDAMLTLDGFRPWF
jgi:hypothetical protein